MNNGADKREKHKLEGNSFKDMKLAQREAYALEKYNEQLDDQEKYVKRDQAG